MKPKKLPAAYFVRIATLVLIVLLLLNYQQLQKKKQQANNANIISRVVGAESESAQPKASREVVNIKSVQETRYNKESQATYNDSQSYLEVYQQLQSARACKAFYMFWEQQGLEADVTNRVSRAHQFYGQPEYSGTEQKPLTAEQFETLEYWVSQCYQLWQDYGVFDGNKATSIPINDVKEAIHSKLNSLVAKTPKERQLKQTMLLISNWAASFARLEDALEGEDSVDLSTAQMLYDELETLQSLDDEVKVQWFEAQANNHPNAESLRDQHFDLLRQIRELEFRIKNQKVVNQDKLKQAQLDFQGHDQAIYQALRTKDGDVFFEIIYALHGKQGFMFNFLGYKHQSNYSTPADQYNISPDQLIYEAAGFENAVLHQWDLRYATHLYLCDLGWDCGPNSPIVMNYCLTGLGSYPDACDKTLPQFYREYFLSPNHWQDVMVFKSWYQELFYE